MFATTIPLATNETATQVDIESSVAGPAHQVTVKCSHAGLKVTWQLPKIHDFIRLMFIDVYTVCEIRLNI